MGIHYFITPVIMCPLRDAKGRMHARSRIRYEVGAHARGMVRGTAVRRPSLHMGCIHVRGPGPGSRRLPATSQFILSPPFVQAYGHAGKTPVGTYRACDGSRCSQVWLVYPKIWTVPISLASQIASSSHRTNFLQGSPRTFSMRV